VVNPAIEGKRYPRTPAYEVGREKVREFSRAVFFPPEPEEQSYSQGLSMATSALSLNGQLFRGMS
jgi:hypothetical protein